MAAATQFAVQGALQKWLSGYVNIQSVTATVQESALTVAVAYKLVSSNVIQVATYVSGGQS
jgi:hypothetical protein